MAKELAQKIFCIKFDSELYKMYRDYDTLQELDPGTLMTNFFYWAEKARTNHYKIVIYIDESITFEEKSKVQDILLSLRKKWLKFSGADTDDPFEYSNFEPKWDVCVDNDGGILINGKSSQHRSVIEYFDPHYKYH